MCMSIDITSSLVVEFTRLDGKTKAKQIFSAENQILNLKSIKCQGRLLSSLIKKRFCELYLSRKAIKNTILKKNRLPLKGVGYISLARLIRTCVLFSLGNCFDCM